MARRLVYLGTPEIAVQPLRALHDAGHDIALVVSQPDRRRGRGAAVSASPVKAAALELGLPVTERIDEVIDSGAELGVVVAYGRLIRPPVLAAVPMVNMHFSLLPRWRGAAPVERAILAGDTDHRRLHHGRRRRVGRRRRLRRRRSPDRRHDHGRSTARTARRCRHPVARSTSSPETCPNRRRSQVR